MMPEFGFGELTSRNAGFLTGNEEERLRRFLDHLMRAD